MMVVSQDVVDVCLVYVGGNAQEG